MKKLFLSAAVALCAVAANAAIEDVRIYINPGHGGWGSGDRHMGTVAHGAADYTDTTGFFESNTNLQKGLALFHKLKEFGVKHNASNARDLTQNLVMSHIKCGTSRNLTEIASEAEINNFDMFISIHSNAATEGTNTNFLLFLYRSPSTTSEVEGNPGSVAMAKACWPYIMKNIHMMWTSYTATGSTNIRGDVTYMNDGIYTTTHTNGKSYQGYYGVLRQGVPGFLVEGYFHTYQPARHKYMNWDVCHMEGIAYAYGINDYFGWGKKESTGYIFGILRDASQTFTHTYYTPNTSTLDKYLPINNATVTLKNSSGVVVSTYTTDDEYNGAFVFKNIEPGTYTLTYSHPDYKDASESVTVTANSVVYPTPQISTSTEVVAVQGHYAYDLKSTQNGSSYTLSFKSTGAFDNGSIIFTNTSTGAIQSIPTGQIVKGDNSVTIDSNSLGADATFTWAVAINNPKSTAYALIHSDNIAYMSGSSYANGGVATDLDQTSPNFGTIYTSTGFGKGIRAYNPDFSTKSNAILGSSFNSSNSSSPYRIATSNGKVYITDWSDAHAGVWVYNPTSGASVTNMFVGTNNGTGLIKNGSITTGGGTTGVSFIGEGANRKMYVFCEDYPTGNAGNQLLRYDLGTADSWSAAPSAAFSSVSASSYMANTNVEVLATENGVFASQTRYNGSNSSGTPSFVVMDASGTITFNSGKSLTTLNGCNSGATALHGNTFAVVNGDGNIEIYTLSWSGSTPSFAHQYTITISGTTIVCQMAFDHAGNLYVYSKQEGLLVYAIKHPARQTITTAATTIKGSVEPAVRGHYAYDLSMETTPATYTLSFKSTGAADNAYILLTNTADNSQQTINLGAISEGENTATIIRNELPQDATFNWAVVIDNPQSPSVELIHTDSSILYSGGTACLGLTIDKDPESDYFGTIYTSTGYGQGIQAFNPDLTRNGDKVLAGEFATDAYTCRMEANSGKVYIADVSSATPGIWMYDPSAATPSVSSVISSQARSVSFLGKGANRQMFVNVFNSNTQLLRYDIGTADIWSGSSSASLYELVNGKGDILATEKGIFMAQTRYSGNNTSYDPVFVVVDPTGTVTFNSSSLASTLTGSNGGAMAISADLSLFAVATVDNVNVQIYSVTWNGNTPSFTFQYAIPLDGTTGVDQMEFDIAGNLYIASLQKGLLVYAIRNDARETCTNAKSDMLLEYSSTTGINEIPTDNTLDAVYYNLQGVKVNPDQAGNGTYIKVIDGKAQKVVLR